MKYNTCGVSVHVYMHLALFLIIYGHIHKEEKLQFLNLLGVLAFQLDKQSIHSQIYNHAKYFEV